MSVSISTVVTIIVFFSIMIFFAEDIANASKKAWKKQWIKLVLPLFGASLLSVVYQEVIYESLTWLLHSMLSSAVNLSHSLGDWVYADEITAVIVLMAYTTIPYGVIQLIHRVLNKKWYPHAWELMLYAWALIIGLSVLDPVHL